jgi:DNA replication protein DnaC
MSNYAQIKEQLSNLKLAGIIDTLEQRLKQADEGELAYTELLSLLLDDELELRRNRKIDRLLTSAGLKGNQTLESFDFRANASINAVQIRELATLRFIEKAENVFLVGSTGVGKTHLTKALAHLACRKNLKVSFYSFANLISEITKTELSNKINYLVRTLSKSDLLVIDDFAFKKISPQLAEYLYSIVDDRYQQRSTIFTSNRVIGDWMGIFPDPVMANAIMDRIAHNAHQITIKGESYRKKNTIKKPNA